jgi:hypothetical protein
MLVGVSVGASVPTGFGGGTKVKVGDGMLVGVSVGASVVGVSVVGVGGGTKVGDGMKVGDSVGDPLPTLVKRLATKGPSSLTKPEFTMVLCRIPPMKWTRLPSTMGTDTYPWTK